MSICGAIILAKLSIIPMRWGYWGTRSTSHTPTLTRWLAAVVFCRHASSLSLGHRHPLGHCPQEPSADGDWWSLNLGKGPCSHPGQLCQGHRWYCLQDVQLSHSPSGQWPCLPCLPAKNWPTVFEDSLQSFCAGDPDSASGHLVGVTRPRNSHILPHSSCCRFWNKKGLVSGKLGHKHRWHLGEEITN